MRTLPALVSLLLLLAGASGAAAQQVTLTGYCTRSILHSGNMTSCDAQLPFTMRSDGPGAIYAAQVQAPLTHCSKVRYVIFPGTVGSPYAEVGYTDFLGPGESAVIRIGELAQGTHPFYVMAVGKVGDCNQGALHSWAVIVTPTVIP